MAAMTKTWFSAIGSMTRTQLVMSVNEDKIKINIRVGKRLKELLEEEAAVEDLRIGTMANILVKEELDKVMAVGISHCYTVDGKDYRVMKEPFDTYPEDFYVFPQPKKVDSFLRTKPGDENCPQISFYFTPEQMDVMKQLVKKQGVRYTVRNGIVKSYRYIVVGLLLNHPLCKELNAAANG